MPSSPVKQQELLPAQPAQQVEHQIVFVSIRELVDQRDRFNISPEYQREDIWTRTLDQQLIDTILLGRGIGLFEGYKYVVEGKAFWEMMDGHQRMSAILRFWDNEYKTWSHAIKRRLQPASKYGAVQPMRHRESMDAYAQNYFLDYHLAINKIPADMSPEERAERFKGIQCQKPLTPAETLNVYSSKANAAARLIAQHPFWDDFYIGEVKRKQLYLSSLYLLALQLTPSGMANLRSGHYIPDLASGKHDNKITDTTVSMIQERLDAASCVYAGMQFTDRAASIAMYQSIMFLEQANCRIQTSTHRARLTDWMSSILDASKRASGLPAYHQPVNKLLYASAQQTFWNRHRKTVMTKFGIKDTAA